jgi:hypothetical protein
MSFRAPESKGGSFGREGAGHVRRACVYTALLNGYEQLNEQPLARDSSVDFVCFTDDPGLTSETWDIRVVEPLFPADAARSQRFLKICAHRVLREYDVSLYIDNSVLLRSPAEAAIDELLGESALALLQHSFRATVRDEFDEVVALGFDTAPVCAEQLEHYAAVDPGSLDVPPLWSGILARRHGDARVVAAMERWFAHVLRYSRRDQLSLWYALRSERLQPVVHLLDNHESHLHRWPVTHGRDRAAGGTPRELAFLHRLLQLEGECDRLDRELTAIRSTRSWRWTAPLRSLRRRLPATEQPAGEAAAAAEGVP